MIQSLEDLQRLDQLVAYWAQATPDACACVSGDLRLSYAALEARIDAVAKALLAAGVCKGDRIATLSPPNADFLICLLATASVGGIWQGLNPRYQIEELKYVVTDSAPKILLSRTRIGDRSFAAEIQALRNAAPSLMAVVTLEDDEVIDGGVTLAAFEAEGAHVSDVELAEARAAVSVDDPCLIVYTSGSTGRPKGALLPHRSIVRFGVRQNRVWPISPLIGLNYFPINHVACVCDVSAPILAAGGTLVFLEQFDARKSLELMEREGVTLWASVVSTFQMQFALPDFASFDLSRVQLIMWGGAAAPEPLVRRLLEIAPRLATNYGMTETMISTTTPPTDDLDQLLNTVGSAFPGVEIRLVREDGMDADTGEPGEIWVRSEYNLLEYWRRPEATADAITADGFFKTGDVAVRRADGNYRISGRLKEMYKSGGYNVYPREIEMVLEEFPNVLQAVVVSIPNPLWQEVGVAYIVPGGDMSIGQLEQTCRAHLANYKVPKHFIIESDLPLLPVGKVDRVMLARRAAERLIAK